MIKKMSLIKKNLNKIDPESNPEVVIIHFSVKVQIIQAVIQKLF